MQNFFLPSFCTTIPGVGYLQLTRSTCTLENFEPYLYSGPVFNEYFSNISKNLSQAIISANPAPEIQHVYRIIPTLSNIKFEKESLVKSFKEHVRESKACGPDNILGKELKMIGEIATEGLYHTVEKSITSCKYPTK